MSTLLARTLEGLDGSEIDFMALTMIDPASSWFKIVELPLVSQLTTRSVSGKEKVREELIFDKWSNQISQLVNYIRFKLREFLFSK